MVTQQGYYGDVYRLSLMVNAVATNNDYMSFRDGAVTMAALGTGLTLGSEGLSRVGSIFSKNKTSKISKLRSKVLQKNELQSLKDSKNPLKTFRNAYRYGTIKKYESKLPKPNTLSTAEYNALSNSKKAKYNQKVLKSGYYDNAKSILDESKTLRGSAQAKKLKEFEKAYAEANLKSYKAKYTGNLKPSSFSGKAVNKIKTLTGIRTGNTAIKTLAANSKVFRTGLKFVKGNALFTAISVLADYDKFAKTKEKVGTKAMMKEVGKSTCVGVAESVGFLAGMKVGAAIGASVGTAVPVVGNIVGGIAGAVLGGLISWGAGKLAHKAMGKSELQKYDEEQAELTALKAQHNEQTTLNLLSRAEEKINYETAVSEATPEERAQAGVENVDTKKLETLKKDYNKVLIGFLDRNPEIKAAYEQAQNTQAEETLTAESVQSAEEETIQTQSSSAAQVSQRNQIRKKRAEEFLRAMGA